MMYKVMLCDDEGIVIDSLSFIIEKHFGAECEIRSAKTGRGAIELADSFVPDIVFMDIQMPGINGIEAIREIKQRSKDVLCIILTAFDRFNYAQQAIDLGVTEYLTKPVNSNRVIDVLQKSMLAVRQRREKISQDLEIKEKLETVVPMIESGMIYNILLQDELSVDITGYKELLGIEEHFGFIAVMEYGDREMQSGGMENQVGASVKMQRLYMEVREVIKGFLHCIVGSAMANKIAILVLCEQGEMEYDERIQIIEKSRMLVKKLSERTELKFKVGIGTVKQLAEMTLSYREALKALRFPGGHVTHISDLPVGPEYGGDYPADLENGLFNAVKKGNLAETLRLGREFYDWMIKVHASDQMIIKLKCMEFVLRAEQEAYSHGGMVYSMKDRSGYLEELIKMKDYEALYTWYSDKLSEACNNIVVKQKEQSSSQVRQAKEYINQNFARELSLDDISRQINISPYYFSKLFKDETGQTFVEYLTGVRIGAAKELLKNSNRSIKEVCSGAGYSDPNYFSRIFKKWVGVTPSEYRERGV